MGVTHSGNIKLTSRSVGMRGLAAADPNVTSTRLRCRETMIDGATSNRGRGRKQEGDYLTRGVFDSTSHRPSGGPLGS